MRKYLVLALAVVLVFGLGSVALAAEDTATQTVTITVDEIAVIDVTGNPGTLEITAPEAGGADPEGDTDNTTYAQYTSVVEIGTRTITAAIDAIPDGLELKLEAVTPTGGEGTVGNGVEGGITLGTIAGDIITGIGSCATGTEATNGANLTYTLNITDLASLVADTTDVTVTLTLTDAGTGT